MWKVLKDELLIFTLDLRVFRVSNYQGNIFGWYKIILCLLELLAEYLKFLLIKINQVTITKWMYNSFINIINFKITWSKSSSCLAHFWVILKNVLLDSFFLFFFLKRFLKRHLLQSNVIHGDFGPV